MNRRKFLATSSMATLTLASSEAAPAPANTTRAVRVTMKLGCQSEPTNATPLGYLARYGVRTVGLYERDGVWFSEPLEVLRLILTGRRERVLSPRGSGSMGGRSGQGVGRGCERARRIRGWPGSVRRPADQRVGRRWERAGRIRWSVYCVLWQTSVSSKLMGVPTCPSMVRKTLSSGPREITRIMLVSGTSTGRLVSM